MMKFFSFIFLIFSISGCTYLSHKFETLAEAKPVAVKNISALPKDNYCASNSNLQLITEDEAGLKFYKTLGPSLFENKSIPFIQKAISLSLVEMARRPDLSSPFGRFQVYLKLGGKNYYFDFRPKRLEDDTRMSQVKGLDVLAKKFLPNQSLMNMAALLDNTVPQNMLVSADLENFLKDNSADLSKNEVLTSHFFKGDEVITKYETFNRFNFKTLIQQYQNPQYMKDAEYDFEKNTLTASKFQKTNYQVNCNYDISKEPSLRDELLATEIRKSHTMGLAEGDNFFLAVSSATLFKPYKTLPKLSYIMKARPNPFPLPVCELKGKHQDIILFSSEGRNPVQHLQHLIAYDIDQIDSSYSLNELLSFSRHLFLSNPDRILYESKRGRKAQLDFFLAMNFPIYHVDSLGNVFGHATFKNDKKTDDALHIDDRNKARLWCK